MRAVILAGGKGARLNPIISDVPKPMAPIRKRPFLEYLLNYWIKQGVDQFVLSIGHMADQIHYYFGNNYRGCPIEYIREEKPLGTGGALLFVLDSLEDTDEAVLVLNGDSYCEVEFREMQEQHEKNNAAITVALTEVKENNRYSGVHMKDNRILSFEKRRENATTSLINAGAYLIYPEVFFGQKWNIGDKLSLEDDLFPVMIRQHLVFGFSTCGRFIDIGIPDDYIRAQGFFKQGSSQPIS